MKTFWILTLVSLCVVTLMLLLSSAATATATTKEELFQRCLSLESADYLISVKQLCGQPDTLGWISNRMERAEVLEEQRMATILFYRKTTPGAFEACWKLLAEIRALPDAAAMREQFVRIIPLTQFLFHGRELEHEYGEEQHGVMSSRQPPRLCPEEELPKRSVAAQLSLIEYFMKFGGDFNDYERIEMLGCLSAIKEKPFRQSEIKRKIQTYVDDLYRKVSTDERLPLFVRMEALSKLPWEEVGRQRVVTILFTLLEDPTLNDENNIMHYAAISRAYCFFADFGTSDELVKLKAFAPKAAWQQQICQKTIQRLETRLEKERTGELNPINL